MNTKHVLDRIDFNESRLRNALDLVNQAQEELNDLKVEISLTVEVDRDIVLLNLLRSEKYRIETAIKMCRFKNEAASMLGMTERTFFRRLNHLNIEK